MAQKNPFTVLTLTATIKNSQSGCCVIVEGSDDIVVYRRLITLYQSKGIKVFPAGGRKNVLDIFDAIKDTEHLKKAIFIVDQDSWVFTGIPTEYQHSRIICTSGYSIENDIYIDKDIDTLINGTGVHSSFTNELAIYLRWFSLAITRFIAGADEKLDIHPDTIFKDSTTQVTYCTLEAGEVFPQSTYDDLLINYALKFRGKCLLPLAIRALGSRSGSPKYNHRTIMEETAIVGRGALLNRIFSEVENLA